jgi:hypothetical protein
MGCHEYAALSIPLNEDGYIIKFRPLFDILKLNMTREKLQYIVNARSPGADFKNHLLQYDHTT